MGHPEVSTSANACDDNDAAEAMMVTPTVSALAPNGPVLPLDLTPSLGCMSPSGTGRRGGRLHEVQALASRGTKRHLQGPYSSGGSSSAVSLLLGTKRRNTV